METWDDHRVTFSSAEGIDKNETAVRVLDQDEDEEVQKELQGERMISKGAEITQVNKFLKGLELESKIREDPGYKFLMMVAAFSSRRLGKLVSSTGGRGSAYKENIDNLCAVVGPNEDQKHWMQEPEISGVIYLSPTIYGHIKESEMILHNGFVSKTSLNTLIEHPGYAPWFARLVALRMALTSALTNPRRLDGTYRRLHQEQAMLLKTLRCVKINTVDYTRPNR